MEPTIKDKYIILGFIGVAICLISFFITLIVSASFNQDNFVRLIVFVCSNILGWLLYLSFQTVIFDSYEIWKLKSSKKKASAGIIRAQEEQLQDANEPAAPTPMPTNREATPDIKPVEIAIAPELHEKNRASYEDRQKQEEAERIRMVMEYIHFVMPRIADKETVNHICAEVNKWMCLQLQAQADNRTADQGDYQHSAPPFRVEHLRAFHVQEILQRGQPCQFYQDPFST